MVWLLSVGSMMDCGRIGNSGRKGVEEARSLGVWEYRRGGGGTRKGTKVEVSSNVNKGGGAGAGFLQGLFWGASGRRGAKISNYRTDPFMFVDT